MWDITRCIPTCCVTGEAAGIAGAMAAKQEKAVMDINIMDLPAQLEQNHVLVN